MTLEELQAELHDLKRWERGDPTAPEPKVGRTPKPDAAIHCECGARFTFAQGFDAWDQHVNGGECPISRED